MEWEPSGTLVMYATAPRRRVRPPLPFSHLQLLAAGRTSIQQLRGTHPTIPGGPLGHVPSPRPVTGDFLFDSIHQWCAAPVKKGDFSRFKFYFITIKQFLAQDGLASGSEICDSQIKVPWRWVAPKSCQALLVQYGFVAPGLTAPLVLDVAILPQTPKLRAMEVRCPGLWLLGGHRAPQ